MASWLKDTSIDKKRWLKKQISERSYFEKEPKSNIDKIDLPPWFNKRLYLNYLKTKFSDWKEIVGEHKRAIIAPYFVIHDTAGTQEYGKGDGLKDPEDRTATRGIHMWLGPKTRYLHNDWHDKGYGTKLESRAANHHFLHIELVRDKKLLDEDTFYSKKQYEILVHAYLVASIRRRSLLTVTSHNEVDRACVVKKTKSDGYSYGHHDPEKFDLEYFYKLVASALGLPSSATFGIEKERVNGKNLAGQFNTFVSFAKGFSAEANQYGPIPNATGHRNDRSKHKKVKLKYGWYYQMPIYKVVGGTRYLPRDVPNDHLIS